MRADGQCGSAATAGRFQFVYAGTGSLPSASPARYGIRRGLPTEAQLLTGKRHQRSEAASEAHVEVEATLGICWRTVAVATALTASLL
jgi:hypothetical protein